MVSCNCKCTFGNIGKKATISHNMVIRLYIDTLHVFIVPLHGALYLIWKAAPQTSPSCFGNLLKGTCATGDVKVSGCRNQQKWHLQLYSCDLWEGTCVKGRGNLQSFWKKCNPEGQQPGIQQWYHLYKCGLPLARCRETEKKGQVDYFPSQERCSLGANFFDKLGLYI